MCLAVPADTNPCVWLFQPTQAPLSRRNPAASQLRPVCSQGSTTSACLYQAARGRPESKLLTTRVFHAVHQWRTQHLKLSMLQIVKDHLQYPQCSATAETEQTLRRPNRAAMCTMGIQQFSMNENFAQGFAQKAKLRSSTPKPYPELLMDCVVTHSSPHKKSA